MVIILNKLFVFFSVNALLLMSCNATQFEQKVISVNSLKRATLDNAQCTAVFIIETFPSKVPCSKNKIFANLYICKKISTNDTIYVFELCQKVPEFALNKNFKENVCIMKEDINSIVPTQVTIFIKPGLKITSNTNYVFASLTRVID